MKYLEEESRISRISAERHEQKAAEDGSVGRNGGPLSCSSPLTKLLCLILLPSAKLTSSAMLSISYQQLPTAEETPPTERCLPTGRGDESRVTPSLHKQHKGIFPVY